MYAITGITGQVGGAVARTLLANNQRVRAVLRDPARGKTWQQQGCELAVAEMHDARALEHAFSNANAAFILLPPNFDPSAGFPETRSILSTLFDALESARPGRVVCISTVGAHAPQENLLTQLSMMEHTLGNLSMPVTFLRPAWFLENAAWDVALAKTQGEFPSFLQPLERKIPMVATADVGRVAAELLQQNWQGVRVVELEGPHGVSPNDIAGALTQLLGREIKARAVPRDQWEALFREQGASNPNPRMQMLDGFNQGWLSFEHAPQHGRIPLMSVLGGLIKLA